MSRFISCTDWICFIVLDIGNSIVFGLPVAAVSGVFRTWLYADLY